MHRRDWTSTATVCALLALLPLIGCAVTPVNPQRITQLQPASLLHDADWPACDVATDPGAESPLPDWVLPCGNYGQGFLYRLLVFPQESTPHFNMFVFLCRMPATAPFTARSLSLNAFSWNVPEASCAVTVSVADPDERPIVGTCIYLASIMGVTDHETPLVHALAHDGWRIITVGPSAQTYDTTMFAIATERGDDANAAMLAHHTDSYLAGTAYASESALRWVAERDPELQNRPVVVIGSSLGALCAPSVVARLRTAGESRVDAAVLIAGGANLLGITANSTVTRDKFRVISFPQHHSPDKPIMVTSYNGDQLDTLLNRAASLSRLDPLNTAATLRDIPVLQLHAPDDKIVPASYGDQLYECLGRPERWTYPFGHSGVFFALPFEADNIARWIAAHTTHALPSPPPPSPPLP